MGAAHGEHGGFSSQQEAAGAGQREDVAGVSAAAGHGARDRGARGRGRPRLSRPARPAPGVASPWRRAGTVGLPVVSVPAGEGAACRENSRGLACSPDSPASAFPQRRAAARRGPPSAAPAIPAAQDCPPGVSASWHGLSPLGCRRGPRFQSEPTCRQCSGAPETACAPASRARDRNRSLAWARNPSPCTTSTPTISRAKSRLGNRAPRVNFPRCHQLIHRKPPPRKQLLRRYLCLSVRSVDQIAALEGSVRARGESGCPDPKQDEVMRAFDGGRQVVLTGGGLRPTRRSQATNHFVARTAVAVVTGGIANGTGGGEFSSADSGQRARTAPSRKAWAAMRARSAR